MLHIIYKIVIMHKNYKSYAKLFKYKLLFNTCIYC